MPPKCPNCKGKMDHEPPNYVCRACGLVVNRFEFDRTKREHFASSRNDDDPDHVHKKRNRDYLDWYLSSDKDDIDED